MSASQYPYASGGIVSDEDGDPLSAHTELQALADLWDEVRGDRPMPQRRDFTPELLRPWLGNLALIDVAHGPVRLQYRLVGTNIVENLKFDPTGKGFDDFVVDPVNNPLTRGLYRCLLEAQPVYEVVRPKYNRYFSFDYNRLALPLSVDGLTVTMILMGEYVVARKSALAIAAERCGRDAVTKIWF